MSAIKLHTLKQKLWAIVAASFIARVVMFFALPNTPSSLAPDEGTYAALADWISKSKPATNFPGYGADLYLAGRSLIFPASVLIRLGFENLYSVRIISSLYGLFGLILFVKILLLVQFKANSGLGRNKNYVVITLVYAFLPSHFLWSNLALRESATEFWILTFMYAYFTIITRGTSTIKLLTLFSSLVLVYSARPPVGWVLGISLLIYAISQIKASKFQTLIPLVFLGMLIGGIFTTTNESEIHSMSPTARFMEFLSPINSSDTNFVDIKNLHLVNQVDADSKISTLKCPFENLESTKISESGISKVACIFWRAPYMTLTFLFRPILPSDVSSYTSLLAASENFFWLFSIIYIGARINRIRKRIHSSFLSPIVLFVGLYVVGAGSYEGNMGTAFRHKSLILWIVLLLLFAVFWRSENEAKDPQGNNSQESAV